MRGRSQNRTSTCLLEFHGSLNFILIKLGIFIPYMCYDLHVEERPELTDQTNEGEVRRRLGSG